MDLFKRFFLVISLVVLTSTFVESVCKLEYIVSPVRATFEEARLLCLQYGMELASPQTVDEQQKVIAAWPGPVTGLDQGVWIGAAKCSKCNSPFVWVNTGKPVLVAKDYSGFLFEKSNYVQKGCIELYKSQKEAFLWNNSNCSEPLGFACQTRCCINECNV